MASLKATWTCLVPENERLRRSSQAASVVQQQLYVFGGELSPRQPVDNKIDQIELSKLPSTSSPRFNWHSAPVFTDSRKATVQTIISASEAPTPRVGAPSTTLDDGTLWIFSGRGGLEMKPIEESGALWCYEVSNGIWSLIRPTDPSAPFPAGRSYHCISSNGVDQIYVHAGCPESGRLSDLWAFDTKRKNWKQLASAPAPARGGCAIAYANAKLYRLHGFDGERELGGSLDVFSEASNSWSTTVYEADGINGPEPRSVACLLPVSNGLTKYLVTMFGERQPSSLGHAGAGKMLPNAWAWDLEKSRWLSIITDEAPAPRGWFDADVRKVPEGGSSIIVHGGLSDQNERFGDVWELTLT